MLVQNPCIIFNSFVFYFVPIFCETADYNETIISLFLMLYSQAAVVCASFMPGYAEKLKGGGVLYLALLMNVIGTGIFVLTWNTAGLTIALVILGLCASFSKPTRQAYYLRQKTSQLYGEDKAMGIYNF